MRIVRNFTAKAGIVLLPLMLPVAAAEASESAVDAALQTLFADGAMDTHLRDRRQAAVLSGSYEVRPGDTLDGIIALAFPGTGIRKSVLRQAFIERNGHAFRNGNPNWLLAGAKLAVPDANDIHALLFEDYDSIRARYAADTSGWVRFP